MQRAHVPEKIAEAYSRLRDEYQFYISLKRINGKYYVYKQTTFVDKKLKKVRARSEYIGRITDDGAFIKKAESKDQELENAKAIILARGGKVVLPEGPVSIQFQQAPSQLSDVDLRIMMILSMNARADLAHFSKILGIQEASIYSKVKTLEKRFGIRYTAEIDVEKLGYSKFLVAVKFLDKKPTAEEIKESSMKFPNVQFAAITSGRYDLFLYILAKSHKEISDITSEIRKGSMGAYLSEWYVNNFYETFGYVPIRGEFMDVLKANISTREYAVLRELINDSSIDFTEIDRKYNFDHGRSDYTYHQLRKNGLIVRPTINLTSVPMRYVGVVFTDIIDYGLFSKNKYKNREFTVSDPGTILNRFVLVGDVGNPKGGIFFVPVFKEGDLERTN